MRHFSIVVLGLGLVLAQACSKKVTTNTTDTKFHTAPITQAPPQKMEEQAPVPPAVVPPVKAPAVKHKRAAAPAVVPQDNLVEEEVIIDYSPSLFQEEEERPKNFNKTYNELQSSELNSYPFMRDSGADNYNDRQGGRY